VRHFHQVRKDNTQASRRFHQVGSIRPKPQALFAEVQRNDRDDDGKQAGPVSTWSSAKQQRVVKGACRGLEQSKSEAGKDPRQKVLRLIG
jgi:chromatin remodeling complex protein RSC6